MLSRFLADSIFSFTGQNCHTLLYKGIVKQIAFPLAAFCHQLLEQVEQVAVMVGLIILFDIALCKEGYGSFDL